MLFVDDTDLMIMKSCIDSLFDLWQECQDATTTWGKLLISTGEALKPKKCFYYLVDYEWLEDGSWQYSELVDLPPLQVPLPDGTAADISRKPVGQSEKTLGIWTNPTGECQK